jgi:hypothetical protein
LAFTALWLLVAVGCVRAVGVLIDGGGLLTRPFETTRPESFILNGARRISEGLPLYLTLGEQPFIVHVYNPLTYLPAGLAGRLFDLDLQGMLVVGRVVSYVSTILLLLVLAAWVWFQGRDWKAAVFAAMAVLFHYVPALTDFFRLRPESPGLLFTFAGLAIFLSGHRRRAALSAVSFFIAFLFKQAFIAAPVSLFVFLASKRDLKNALAFSCTLGGLLIAFFLCMYFLTGRNFFENTVVSMAVNDVRPVEMLLSVHGPRLVKPMWGLVLALVPALLLLFEQGRLRALVVYFFVCCAWTFFSAGKYGAQVNYFSELTILSIVIIALSLGLPGKRRSLAAFIVLLFVGTHVLTATIEDGFAGKRITERDIDLSPYVEMYGNMPGEKLITHEGIAVHTGDIVGLDWYLLSDLRKKGLVDLAPLFRQISEGKFSVVVLDRRVRCQLQLDILKAVQKGPYELRRDDEILSEWVRRPRESRGPTGANSPKGQQRPQLPDSIRTAAAGSSRSRIR